MLKKFTLFVRKLAEKLSKMMPGFGGYLAHCEDCNRLTKVFLFKETGKFMCKPCMVRYAKLYIKLEEKRGQVA